MAIMLGSSAAGHGPVCNNVGAIGKVFNGCQWYILNGVGCDYWGILMNLFRRNGHLGLLAQLQSWRQSEGCNRFYRGGINTI